MTKYKTKEGNYNRPGVTQTADGVIFSFEGKKEETCAVLLYDSRHHMTDRIEVPSEYTLGSVRSIEVMGLKSRRLIYNYEVNGSVITDPYARVIIGREKWFDTGRSRDDYAIYGGYDPCEFDWGKDARPEIARKDMVMYKLHVRGFSMDAGLRDKSRGTFAAIKNKIPYLKSLGITTIELMPVYEFEELVIPQCSPLPDYIKWEAQDGDMISQMPEMKVEKVNYWGYVPGNYFAVKSSYASSDNASVEFKELIRELHANGMECVMEMWFDERLNQNRIIEALRYWVREYHVDGFHLLGSQVPVTAVAQDILLSRTKIFCDGFEQFLIEDTDSYHHLFVYNDEYLYPTRKILNHMGGSLEEFLGEQRRQHPVQGYVNYIAGSNGFTLYDVFSYAEKHNQANGEDNCDGVVWNFSSNCGIEGRTTNRYVTGLREKQLRNAIAVLLLGQGVPLIHAGDEGGNTQEGNNNAYCQDNKTGWINWKKMQKFDWLTDFTRRMIEFRKAHPIISLDVPMQMNDYRRLGCPDMSYHAENAWQNDFSGERMAAGVMYSGSYASDEQNDDNDFVYVGYNFHTGLQHLALPKLPENKKWHLVMDTSKGREPFLETLEPVEGQLIKLQGQSVVILVSK